MVEADGHKVYFSAGARAVRRGLPLGPGGGVVELGSVFDDTTPDALLRVRPLRDRIPWPPRDSSRRRRATPEIRCTKLEQLLTNGGIAKPYVLVGHSWGGTLARLYAGTHDDVKAVVFVDSSSPGQDTTLAAALPPRRVGSRRCHRNTERPESQAARVSRESRLGKEPRTGRRGDEPGRSAGDRHHRGQYVHRGNPLLVSAVVGDAERACGSLAGQCPCARAEEHAFVQTDAPDVDSHRPRGRERCAREPEAREVRDDLRLSRRRALHGLDGPGQTRRPGRPGGGDPPGRRSLASTRSPDDERHSRRLRRGTARAGDRQRVGRTRRVRARPDRQRRGRRRRIRAEGRRRAVRPLR